MKKADKKLTKAVVQVLKNDYLYIIIDSHNERINQR